MTAVKRKKEIVTGYVSPHIKKLIKKIVEDGDYASESDFVAEAVIRRVQEYLPEKRILERVEV
jgi:Arc/MetJ-type ribon-helix-helix transcriptional regulator